MNDFNREWEEFLDSIHAKGLPWGITGGNEWIAFRQNNDNDFSVQIFLHGDFNDYKKQSEAVTGFFKQRDSVLEREFDVQQVAYGFYKQLDFVDCKKKIESEEKKKALSVSYIETQVNGNINQNGGIINTGKVREIKNSIQTDSTDTRWFQKEIVKMIFSFISGIMVTLVGQWIMNQ